MTELNPKDQYFGFGGRVNGIKSLIIPLTLVGGIMTLVFSAGWWGKTISDNETWRVKHSEKPAHDVAATRLSVIENNMATFNKNVGEIKQELKTLNRKIDERLPRK